MIRKLLIAFMLGSAGAVAAEREVQGLACPFCAWGMEKKLKSLPGVVPETIDIRLNEGRVTFRADTDATITEDRLGELIRDAGFTLRTYHVRPVGQAGDPKHEPGRD